MIYNEYEDRYYSCREELERVRIALKDAIKEIEEHNSEYHYITSKEKIEDWKMLL